jgi:Recombinase
MTRPADIGRAAWREEIGKLTRAALAAKRAQGVRLGRPRSIPPEVTAKIAAMRQAGRSLPAIADELNSEGVPTAHGGARWYPSTIARVLSYLAEEAAACRG